MVTNWKLCGRFHRSTHSTSDLDYERGYKSVIITVNEPQLSCQFYEYLNVLFIYLFIIVQTTWKQFSISWSTILDNGFNWVL